MAPPVDALRRASVGPLVGAELGEGPLVEDSRATWAANVTLRARLKELMACFERASIPVVALKGWATLARFPGWMPARGTRDVDLLVSPRAFERACEVLVAEGFTPEVASEPASMWWSGQREFRASAAGFRVAIDLHRGLHHPPVWRRLSAAVLERSERVDGVRVPSLPASLWVIAAHRARHAWTGDPREWIDAYLIARELTPEDAHAWAAGAAALGVDGASWALWRDVTSWLGTPTPAWDAAASELARGLSPARTREIEAWREGRRPLPRPLVRLRFIDMYRPLPAMGASRGSALAGATAHALLRAVDALWARDAGVLRTSARAGVVRAPADPPAGSAHSDDLQPREQHER